MFYERTGYRLVTAAFGVLVFALGLFIAFFVESSGLMHYAAGAGLAVLGGNAVWAAARSVESWLGKIGPLP